MSDTYTLLLEAYHLIKAGDRAQAEPILQPIVAADENNADAWWLLANALDKPDEQRRALYRVLELRPNHAKAEQMLADLDAQYLPSVHDLVDLPFDATYGDEQPYQVRVTKPKNSNRTLYIILTVVGAIMVVGCAVMFFLASGLTMFVNEIMDDPEFAALIDELAEGGVYNSSSAPSLNAASLRGVVEPGQRVTGTVGTFTNDRWTFTGRSGDRLVIELNRTDSTLDPVLYVFNPDGSFLAENDDGGTGLNSHLEIHLPESGTYTIVVSAFVEGGDYELTLRSRSTV